MSKMITFTLLTSDNRFEKAYTWVDCVMCFGFMLTRNYCKVISMYLYHYTHIDRPSFPCISVTKS